jgi:amino acid transporter
MAKVTYCFSGWSNALNVIAEVKSRDPIRTVRKACYISVAAVSFLYLTAISSFMVVLPKNKIKDSGQLVGAVFAKEVFGHRFGGTAFSVVIAISSFGGTVGSVRVPSKTLLMFN